MIRRLARALPADVDAGPAQGSAARGNAGDAIRSGWWIGQGSKRGVLAALALVALWMPVRAGEENDYPTDARVDYVFACMAANGQTRESLQKCSCSLDQLAAILPYDKYVQASTVLSMRQGIGNRANEFKSTKVFDDKVADLRRAQAEAEIRCYRG